MKRILSITLSAAIILSTFVFAISPYAKGISEKGSTNADIDKVAAFIAKSDKDKDYTTYAEYDHKTNYSEEKTAEKYNDKYQFQTFRLIVKSKNDIDFQNATSHIKYDGTMYILEYKNSEDTEKAYDYYSNLSGIEYVEPDRVLEGNELVDTGLGTASSPVKYDTDNSDFDTYDVDNHLSKGTEYHKITEAKQYVLDNSSTYKDEVVVAVLDSGVSKGHKMLEGRFKGGWSAFTSDGEPADGGHDWSTLSHGTKVASIIVDSTLPNTKIMSYQVANKKDEATYATLLLAIDKAIEDGVDVINMSYSGVPYSSMDEYYKKAVDNGIAVINSASNSNIDLNNESAYSVCSSIYALYVSGTELPPKQYVTSYSHGSFIDVYALGKGVYVASKDGAYESCDGASFSAPAVAGTYALLKTMYPDESPLQLYRRIISGATQEVYDANGNYAYADYLDAKAALLYANPKVVITKPPTIKVEDIPNSDSKKVTIIPNETGSIICYSRYDNKYPYLIYTEPLILTPNELSYINVYATEQSKDEFRSEVSKKGVYSGVGENGFYASTDGTVYAYDPSEYVGDSLNPVMPDTIAGIVPIKVEGRLSPAINVGKRVFPNEVQSVTMPNTITSIGSGAFSDCDNLEKVIAPNVTEIGKRAFQGCENLSEIEFSEITTVDSSGFNGCQKLSDFSCFENVTTLGSAAFRNTGFTDINLNKLEKLENYTFQDSTSLVSLNCPKVTNIPEYLCSDCTNLTYVNMPSVQSGTAPYAFINTNIKSIELGFEGPANSFDNCNIDYVYFPNETEFCDDFYGCVVKRAEFEKLTSVRDISPCIEIMTIPSGVIYIDSNTQSPDLKIYGTEGSYASRWAKKYGVTFVNISQDTALVKDVPMKVTDPTVTLTPDVIGFNRTYQWYTNTIEDNSTGTPIPGATSKSFTPSDYPPADYYYCVITSTDEGYDPVTIRTGVSIGADYTQVNAAKDKIPSDLSNYTTDSVAKLNAVLAGIKYDLPLSDQAIVDGYAKDLEVAIAGLVLKTPESSTTTTTTAKETTTTKSNKDKTTTKPSTTKKSTANKAAVKADTNMTSPNTGNDAALILSIGAISTGMAIILLKIRKEN